MSANRQIISLGNILALSPSTYVVYTGILLLLAILLASCGGSGSSGGGSSAEGASIVDFDGDGISDADDLCPRGATGWTSNSNTDTDGDGCRDSDEDAFPNDPTEHRDTDGDGIGNNADTDDDNDKVLDTNDVDDDGDSLIEITTLEQLHSLRDDLDGNGTDDGNLPDVTALGDTGCPQSGCTGYELINNLDFTDSASYTSGTVNTTWTTGAGWPGIGSFTTASSGTIFSGNFTGNSFTIANLFINASATTNGTGLFAAANGTMSNLILMDARVSGGARHVSIFIGSGRNSDIRNVRSDGVLESTGNRVGGLIGDGVFATVNNSYASGSVSGRDLVGGLIGGGDSAKVSNSYASGSVSGRDLVGGLIGRGSSATVTASYATGSVSGDVSVGGLLGRGALATVVNSYVTGSVSGINNNVGGLIGEGQRANVVNSYATGFVSDTSLVSGLVSVVIFPPTISSSYWDTNTTGQTNSSGGGEGKTTNELQSPTSFTGSIYANWGSALCADGTRAWDLGTASQYPALTCTPGGVAAQR